MGRHSEYFVGLSRTSGAGAVVSARSGGYRLALPSFSFVISLAIIFVTVIAPSEPASADTVPAAALDSAVSQKFVQANNYTTELVRDNYGATPKPIAPRVAIPDPGTAQAIAYELVLANGWGDDQFACLVALWDRESHWNVYAENPYSGAYGIPQALPGNKMASAGSDWKTSAATQIRWGIGYIAGRYGTPCGAWEHSETHNWY